MILNSLTKTILPGSPIIKHRYQNIFRYIFWTGYFAVLTTAFLPISIRVDRIKFGPQVFEIRLDHILHFSAYFLICIYYLAGKWKGLTLFDSRSLGKFVAFTLALAVVTEAVQIWVPARTFNVFDLLSNVIGVFLGIIVINLLKLRREDKL